jgi:polyisoprenoid-binding protein YceI
MQEGTEARFYIDEVLMGSDKTVIGVTSLVEGQIMLDPANPGRVQLTPIRIDARDLTTDSNQRNGAIRRFVLQSNQEQYQYIIFEPTAITGLPATVELGQPFTFAVTGQLTIRDITREETFQLSVTATSETEVVGIGATTILRDNYALTIPSVPSVANVSEEVKLEIEFVAAAS